MANTQMKPDPPDEIERRRRLVRSATIAGALTLFVPLLASLALSVRTAPTFAAGARAAVGAMLGSLAPLAVGALLGFLFGIPRTVASPTTPHDPTKAAGSPDGARVAPNTNLEQISDWLSKLLVGVGLTQIGSIPDGLRRISRYMRPLFGGTEGPSEARAAVVVVFFVIGGFFLGYLTTRLLLQGMFRQADEDANRRPDASAVADINRLADPKAAMPGMVLGGIDDRVKREVLRFDLDQLHDARDLRAWGLATLSKGDNAEAERAFEKALLTVGNDPDERQHLVEGLMLSALYADPPAGFFRAITFGELFRSRQAPGGEPSPSILVWLACAYGQAHHWENRDGKGNADLLQTYRRRAHEAATSAIKADPAWKPVLAAALTNSEGDNDLHSFAQYEEFTNLLL